MAIPEDTAALFALWAVAYLIGAVPVSYLLGKALGGIDLRRHGSGNVGASNLAKQLGRRWWLPAAAVDLSRGAAPILVGQYVLVLDGMGWWLALTPLFTLLGNAWSPFLRFTGGRSVGVWAGGMLGIAPLFFTAGLLMYAAGWRITRRSAEWLLVVMGVLPALALVWPERWLPVGGPEPLAFYCGAGAMLILVKRLVSNGKPASADTPRRAVILNRLLRDRDIADREQWLSRTTQQGNETG